MDSPTESSGKRPFESGFLAFVAIDIINFVLFLSALGVESISHRSMFSSSSELLDRNLGILNTSILLTSGFLVALAMRSMRTGNPKQTATILSLATVIGAAFGAVKIVEYGEKVARGLTPQTNEFFAFYYVITGVHLLHWTVGLGILFALTVTAFRGGHSAAFRKWLPIGALFWHMVDVIWILIFPCLYFQWAR